MGDREVKSTLREKARQRSVRRGLGGIVEQHNTSSNKNTQARYVIRPQEATFGWYEMLWDLFQFFIIVIIISKINLHRPPLFVGHKVFGWKGYKV